MAKFNRFLIILITILAVAAAVMSYFLFERRNEFRDRATVLSQTVADIVMNLDEESGTKLRREVDFEPAIAEEGISESGSLSWQNYRENSEQYEALLDNAVQLSEQVNSHKNYLAEILQEISFELGMTDDDIAKTSLTETVDQDEYENTAEQITRLVTAYREQNDDFIQTLRNTGNIIDEEIDEEKIKSRKTETTREGDEIKTGFQHESVLDSYVDAVIALNTRCSDYASAITDLTSDINAHDWDTDFDDLDDPDDYSNVLTALSRDASDINDKLIELEEKKKQLSRANEKLEDAQAEAAKLKEQSEDLSAEKSELEKRLEETREELSEYRSEDERVGDVISLEDDVRIAYVNETWNFVVVNTGGNLLKPGVELAVVRDGEFIARLEVTKVTPSTSVANVLQSVKQGNVQVGDRVITSVKFEEE